MSYPSWLQGAGGEDNGELFNGYRASVWDDEKVLVMVMLVAQQCERA